MMCPARKRNPRIIPMQETLMKQKMCLTLAFSLFVFGCAAVNPQEISPWLRLDLPLTPRAVII